MIRKIISIVICLLVIIGTVSCAADKKETPAEDAKEEEESSSSEEDLPFELRYAEDFDQMADSAVQALFLPNMPLLLGSFHPDMLAYMTRVDGTSEEALYAMADEADTAISQAWAKLDGAAYADLTYQYTVRQVNDTQWDELNALYSQVALEPEEAAVLTVTLFCGGDTIGSFPLSLVRIDGTWWTDPVLFD